MPRDDDNTAEFQRELKALLDRYPPKERALAVLFNALLGLYPKGRHRTKQPSLRALGVGNALLQTRIRPGPKRNKGGDDTSLLILMGQHMSWRPDLSLRKAAEIATRHLPDDKYRLSIIDRIRKAFAEDKEYYLMTGKINAIINLILSEPRASAGSDNEDEENAKSGESMVTVKIPDDDILEAKFQELRSRLRAVYTFSDKGAIVTFPKLG